MKNSLFDICDEIFRSQRLPIHSRALTPNQVAFPDYPWTGLTTTAEDCLMYWTIYVQDQFGGRVYTRNLNLPTFPETVEQVLRFIYEEFVNYFDQPTTNATKPHHEPEITLKIDENTPTAVLETLAAMAMGWSLRDGHYWVDSKGDLQELEKHWKPTLESSHVLLLASKLGLQIKGTTLTEIRFNITLAAAQKYVQGI